MEMGMISMKVGALCHSEDKKASLQFSNKKEHLINTRIPREYLHTKSYAQSLATSNAKSLAKSYAKSLATSNAKSLAKSYDKSLAKSLAKPYSKSLAKSYTKSHA